MNNVEAFSRNPRLLKMVEKKLKVTGFYYDEFSSKYKGINKHFVTINIYGLSYFRGVSGRKANMRFEIPKKWGPLATEIDWRIQELHNWINIGGIIEQVPPPGYNYKYNKDPNISFFGMNYHNSGVLNIPADSEIRDELLWRAKSKNLIGKEPIRWKGNNIEFNPHDTSNIRYNSTFDKLYYLNDQNIIYMDRAWAVKV